LLDARLETWKLKDHAESNEQSDHAEGHDYEKDWGSAIAALSQPADL
jgi:hypothetical protein